MRPRRRSAICPVKKAPLPPRPVVVRQKPVKAKAEVAQEPAPVSKKKSPEPVTELSSRRTRAGPAEKAPVPPPEYCPLKLLVECPKIEELLNKETKLGAISQVEMIRLQHDLEHLMAFATSAHNRAVGEVAFLTSGDYPIIDLSSRPTSVFTNRFVPELDETEYTLDNLDMGKQVSLCGLPTDTVEDDIDFWPPNHIPTRFWKWCMETFLIPLDAEFLRDFKAMFVDPILTDEFDTLYLNEPWKNRKREKQRGKRKGRMSSPELMPPPPMKKRPPLRDRLCHSIEALIDALNREENLKGQSSPRSASPPPLNLAKMVELAKVKMEEAVVAREEALTDADLLSEACDLFDEFECDEAVSKPVETTIPAEPSPEPVQQPGEFVQQSPRRVSESPRRSLRSPRLASPRLKTEPVENDEDFLEADKLKPNDSRDLSPRLRNGERRDSLNSKESDVKVEIEEKTNDSRSKSKKKENEEEQKEEKYEGTNNEEQLQEEEETGEKKTKKKNKCEKLMKKFSDPNFETNEKKRVRKQPELSSETIGLDLEEDPCSVYTTNGMRYEQKYANPKTRTLPMKIPIPKNQPEVDFSDKGTVLDPTKVKSRKNGKIQRVYTLDEKIYHGIGAKIIQILVAYYQLPKSVLSIFPFFLGHDLNVDYEEEGKIPGEPDELDEVSAELTLCQQELKEFEPDIKGTITHTWRQIERDFAFWETYRQLEEADNTLFRLIVNTYNDFPRRFPKPSEWPSILTAKASRQEKVKMHYSNFLRRQPTLALTIAEKMDDPNDVEELS